MLVELASASRQTPMESVSPAPIHREGFLFLNGQYLTPPYSFSCQAGEVRVNGRQLQHSAEDWNRICYKDATANMPSDQELQENLKIWLTTSTVLVSFPEQPLVMFRLSEEAGATLIEHLTDHHSGATWVDEMGDRLPEGTDRDQFRSWLSEFHPPDELTRRASDSLGQLAALEQDHSIKSAAIRRLDFLAYPLTMGGMLLCVFSIGHLMIYRPEPGAGSYDVDTSAMAQKMVSICIGLVVIFSGLDLFWTILATQAGQMREMNPIGSHLVDNPWALSVYKVAATSLAAGLFYGFRKYRRIQMASWWACLTLTLLTVRWVAIHSLMMG